MALKDKLLEKFSANINTYFSGEELAEEFSVSRAAVWKAVRSLQNEGFDIDSSQSRGYCFTANNDFLREDLIRSHAPDVEYPVYVFDEIDSTNNYAKILCAKGAVHGTLIAANHQTAGRGRRGRSFYSPKNTGLYLSLIIQPRDSEHIFRITPAAAVAAVEAIAETTGIHTGIKWVNDLFIAERKTAGILTEAITDFETGQIDRIIIGIGINCRDSELPEDIRDTAGSLGADNLSRSVLAAALWKRLLYWCNHLDDPALMEAYRMHSVVLGKEITYTYNNQLMQGKAVSIDDDGHLIIEKPDHSTQVLQSGEVSIRSWQRS